MIRALKNILWTVLSMVLVVLILIFSASVFVLKTGEKHITDINNVPDSSYILVFGASVNGNKVSHALSQRLDTVYSLYKNNKAEKIIVSGDHLLKDYNEVKAMKDYLVKKGVLSADIIMDHSGEDTFVSVSRLKENINPDSVIFVTQEEHLKRALYYAEKFDINAKGVPCENYSSEQVEFQKKREFLARVKAFAICELFNKDADKFDRILKLVYDENIN